MELKAFNVDIKKLYRWVKYHNFLIWYNLRITPVNHFRLDSSTKDKLEL